MIEEDRVQTFLKLIKESGKIPNFKLNQSIYCPQCLEENILSKTKRSHIEYKSVCKRCNYMLKEYEEEVYCG